MKRALIIVAVVAAAYLAGFLQQRAQTTRVERERESLQQRVQSADDRLRVAALLVELLQVTDQTVARNYGEAGTLATRYFDGARDEAARATDGRAKQALAEILAQRDGVTSALARSDPAILTELQKEQRALRTAIER